MPLKLKLPFFTQWAENTWLRINGVRRLYRRRIYIIGLHHMHISCKDSFSFFEFTIFTTHNPLFILKHLLTINYSRVNELESWSYARIGNRFFFWNTNSQFHKPGHPPPKKKTFKNVRNGLGDCAPSFRSLWASIEAYYFFIKVLSS